MGGERMGEQFGERVRTSTLDFLYTMMLAMM